LILRLFICVCLVGRIALGIELPTTGNVTTAFSLASVDLLTNISLNALSSYSSDFPVTLIGTLTINSNDPEGFKIEVEGTPDSENYLGEAAFLRAGGVGAAADIVGEYAKVKVSLTETDNTRKGASPDIGDSGTFYEVGSSVAWSFTNPDKATVDLDYDVKIDVDTTNYKNLLVGNSGSIYTCTLNIILSDF
jgi:hypothetical protein